MDRKRKIQKYDNDYDRSRVILLAFILVAIVLVCGFVLEGLALRWLGERSYLTPELLHTIIYGSMMWIAGIISGLFIEKARNSGGERGGDQGDESVSLDPVARRPPTEADDGYDNRDERERHGEWD